MQNEQTLEQMIKEYEANMPPEIMSLIKSFDWKKEMRTIVNQNQLMIDVGADLEQSIYLMILGAVDVEDVYERLMDIHEIPEDKAQKIIGEIETQIFNPLHKKLIELDSVDTKETKESNETKDSRANILAEIEKEPAPVIPKLNFDALKQQITAPVVEDKGITKPFTIASTKVVDVQEPMLATGKIVEGAQEDPVSAGLKNPTVTQAQPVQAPEKPYVADPYRESIG
jgi:hypothetical protein